MNEDAYKVLGVSRDASQEEIKRAYFRMVRQHTPDSDPEMFQEIRRAYEALKDMEEQKKDLETISLEVPDDPMGKKMMEQILSCYGSHDYQRVIDTAQEAVRYFGNCSGFLYYLALAQREAGYTGKSVRNLELLVEKFPDEVRFRRELAISLQERGFGKKALDAFETAWKMGCRDTEFLFLFNLTCYERRKYARGVQILETLIGDAGRKTVLQPLEYLQPYEWLLISSASVSDEKFRQSAERFAQFLLEAGGGLDGSGEELAEMFLPLAMIAYGISKNDEIPEMAAGWMKVTYTTIREAVWKILAAAQKAIPDGKLWKETQKQLEHVFVMGDPELSISIRCLVDAFVGGDEREDPQFTRFIQLDSMLCILEEWPENRGQIEILKHRYPETYSRLEEFVRRLDSEAADWLRDSMLKDYRRLAKYFDGYYFQRYPERRQEGTRQVWDSDQEGTFRRAEKKVGRNDPCPCGSGKKYKNCCGRKG